MVIKDSRKRVQEEPENRDDEVQEADTDILWYL